MSNYSMPSTVDEMISLIESDLYHQGISVDDLSQAQINEIERQLKLDYDENGNRRKISFSRFSIIENVRGLEE